MLAAGARHRLLRVCTGTAVACPDRALVSLATVTAACPPTHVRARTLRPPSVAAIVERGGRLRLALDRPRPACDHSYLYEFGARSYETLPAVQEVADMCTPVIRDTCRYLRIVWNRFSPDTHRAGRRELISGMLLETPVFAGQNSGVLSPRPPGRCTKPVPTPSMRFVDASDRR
jgi:hypothetical protein